MLKKSNEENVIYEEVYRTSAGSGHGYVPGCLLR
jgi:hypothetical protein